VRGRRRRAKSLKGVGEWGRMRACRGAPSASAMSKSTQPLHLAALAIDVGAPGAVGARADEKVRPSVGHTLRTTAVRK
jgi:hypothetical protein